MDSTNKIPVKLKTDQGQGKTKASTAIQLEHQSASKTRKVSKVMVQLDPDKNMWTPAEIIQSPVQDGRSYSLKTIHGGVYTRNRGS